MSDIMPMYALDKVEKKFAVKVNTFVRLEARAKDEGKAVAAIVNHALDELVRDDPFTPEMVERAKALMDNNLAKRNAMKAKKGIKYNEGHHNKPRRVHPCQVGGTSRKSENVACAVRGSFFSRLGRTYKGERKQPPAPHFFDCAGRTYRKG